MKIKKNLLDTAIWSVNLTATIFLVPKNTIALKITTKFKIKNNIEIKKVLIKTILQNTNF